MLFGIEFRTKKSASAYIYLPRSGARGSKDTHIIIIIMWKNGKVDSLWGSTFAKNTRHINKKVQIKVV